MIGEELMLDEESLLADPSEPLGGPGHSNYLLEFKEAIAQAEAQGFTVVRSSPRTLLLDLDTAEHKAQFERMVNLLNEFTDAKVTERWPSKSGISEHVLITMDRDMTATERILLQLALGSDPEHEILSLVTGHMAGQPRAHGAVPPSRKGGEMNQPSKGYAAIGNGVYAETRGHGLSLMDWYRRLQAACVHEKRDPKGICYNCGQRAL